MESQGDTHFQDKQDVTGNYFFILFFYLFFCASWDLNHCSLKTDGVYQVRIYGRELLS